MGKTGQGSRARGGADAGLFVIRNPRGLARALTLVLVQRLYLLRWTATGPELLRMSARQLRPVWRERERVKAEYELAQFRRATGRRDPPLQTTSGEKIARVELARLRVEEMEFFSVTKSAQITEAAHEMGLSYSTLHRLLHGRLSRLSWRNAGRLRDATRADEWLGLRLHLWPRRRWEEYDGRLPPR